jgi:hypothetical protein
VPEGVDGVWKKSEILYGGLVIANAKTDLKKPIIN